MNDTTQAGASVATLSPAERVARRRAIAQATQADAELATALALVAHAAGTAARVHRLTRYGMTSDDVYATAVLRMQEATAAGSPIPTDPASIGRLCKRVAAAMVVVYAHESPAGLAPGEPVTQADADESATRSRAAVLAKHQRTQNVHRTDVYAVSDYSRMAMRPADAVSIHRADAAAVVAAMLTAWSPARPAERAAWDAMGDSPAARVDAMGDAYRPLILATNRTQANRPGDVMAWRAMPWADVMPNASPATRAALRRAALAWDDHVSRAPAQADAERAGAMVLRGEIGGMMADREGIGTGSPAPAPAVLAQPVTVGHAPAAQPDTSAAAGHRGMLAYAVTLALRGHYGCADHGPACPAPTRDHGSGWVNYPTPWDAALSGCAAMVDHADAALFAERVSIARVVGALLDVSLSGCERDAFGLQVRAELHRLTA